MSSDGILYSSIPLMPRGSLTDTDIETRPRTADEREDCSTANRTVYWSALSYHENSLKLTAASDKRSFSSMQ
jgi:hypothetical protein